MTIKGCDSLTVYDMKDCMNRRHKYDRKIKLFEKGNSHYVYYNIQLESVTDLLIKWKEHEATFFFDEYGKCQLLIFYVQSFKNGKDVTIILDKHVAL